MSWDRYVYDITGALGYAILIVWEYIKMGVVRVAKAYMRWLRW